MKQKSKKVEKQTDNRPIIIEIISDTHLGLVTDGIVRDDEIKNCFKQIISRCVKHLEDGFRAILVINGDLLNVNDPSESTIRSVIWIMNLIHKYKIETYINLGNHESISNPDKLSCLGFIKEAKKTYKTITLIEDIKFMEVAMTENGPLYFTFLPHITTGTVRAKYNEGKLEEMIHPQEYIETKSLEILQKVGKDAQHIVFSHLNVYGAHGGSEENMLRKSLVYLPKAFINTPPGYAVPTIIQGHIHTNQIIDNIYIGGSPIFCSYGEKGPKYSTQVTISDSIGKADSIRFIKTPYIPFYNLELNLIGYKGDFMAHDDVKTFFGKKIKKENEKGRKPFIKIEVVINKECNTFNWEEIVVSLHAKYKCVIKPINPVVTRERFVRSVDQKLGLPHNEALKVFIKKNLKSLDKESKIRRYKLGLKYMEMD